MDQHRDRCGRVSQIAVQHQPSVDPPQFDRILQGGDVRRPGQPSTQPPLQAIDQPLAVGAADLVNDPHPYIEPAAGSRAEYGSEDDEHQRRQHEDQHEAGPVAP